MSLVRLFTHASVQPFPVDVSSGRYTTDSVAALRQPYLAREAVTAGTGAAVATSAALTEHSQSNILRIEVEAGKTIAMECNQGGRAVVATVNSPYYSGVNNIRIGQGWTFSILEITVA